MAREASGAETKHGTGGPRGNGKMGAEGPGSGGRDGLQKGRKKSAGRRGQRSKTWSPARRARVETRGFESVKVKQEVVSEDERKRAKAQQMKLPLEDWKENADRERRAKTGPKDNLDVRAKKTEAGKMKERYRKTEIEGGRDEEIEQRGKGEPGAQAGERRKERKSGSSAESGSQEVKAPRAGSSKDESNREEVPEEGGVEEVEVVAVWTREKAAKEAEMRETESGEGPESEVTEAMEESEEQEEPRAEDMDTEGQRAAGKRKGRELGEEEEVGRKKRGDKARWGDEDDEEMEEEGQDPSDEERTCRTEEQSSESEWSDSSSEEDQTLQNDELSSEGEWSISSRGGRFHERWARRQGKRAVRRGRGEDEQGETGGRRGSDGGRDGEELRGRKRKGGEDSGRKERAGYRGMKEREDRDRREKRKEENPALKFLLQKRGMADIGNRVKLQTDLTIELFYRGEEGTMNPRKKMEDLIARMTQEDPQIEFLAGDSQADITGGALDDPEFYRMIRLREIKKRTSMVAKVTMRSTRLLRSMKHENGGKFVRWLTRERIVINIDRWSRESYADIGFLILRHPTATWKPDMEEEIRAKIRKDAMAGESDIPKFLLYHGKKAFGTGDGRASATVMYVQCKAEDASGLKALLGRGKGTRKLAFIPAGYHLQTSPKRVIQALNAHNKYVNARKMIAIVGISEDQMKMTISHEGERVVVKELLKSRLGVEYIERTNRTRDLGKWLLVAEDRRSDEIKQKLDQVLDGIRDGLKRDGISDKVGAPRRTDRSIMETRYKEYLDSLEDIIPDTQDLQPVIQVQNRSRKRMNEDRKLGDGPPRTFSDAVKRSCPAGMEPGGERERSQGQRETGGTYEERAKALRDEFEEKLNAHMKLSEDRILRESMESQARLVKTLENHSEKTEKIMQSMVSQTEGKVELLGSQMNEKIGEVTEMYRVLTGQFAELEKLVRAVVSQRGGIEVTPTKSPIRKERGSTGEWNERTRRGVSLGSQKGREE